MITSHEDTKNTTAELKCLEWEITKTVETITEAASIKKQLPRIRLLPGFETWLKKERLKLRRLRRQQQQLLTTHPQVGFGYSKKQVSIILGVSPRYIEKQINSGNLQLLDDGRPVIFSDNLKYFASQAI